MPNSEVEAAARRRRIDQGEVGLHAGQQQQEQNADLRDGVDHAFERRRVGKDHVPQVGAAPGQTPKVPAARRPGAGRRLPAGRCGSCPRRSAARRRAAGSARPRRSPSCGRRPRLSPAWVSCSFYSNGWTAGTSRADLRRRRTKRWTKRRSNCWRTAPGLPRPLAEFPEDVAAAAKQAADVMAKIKQPTDPAAEPWPPMRAGDGL